MRQVADLAGVAVGTVSHVITGALPVSEPLRRKVHAAIRQLDYYPNHSARSLKTRKTRTLGIIVPDLTIAHFAEIIRGADAAACGQGYSLIAVSSGDDAERQRDLLSLLRSQRVDGILLVVAAAPAPVTQIARIVESGGPVVCLDRIPDRLAVDTVSVEDEEAARLGMEHLIQQGSRRIAIVAGPQTLRNERQRLRGCRTALEQAGRTLEQDLVWCGNLRADRVAAMCRERLTQGMARPDAIFCTNGPSGLGALRALRQCVLRTPDDLAFATVDELGFDEFLYPSITSVVQPSQEIGRRAVELLVRRVACPERSGPAEAIRLRATLKIGNSSQRR